MFRGKHLLTMLALGACTLATMIVESMMMQQEVKEEVKEQLKELNEDEEG